MEVSPVQFKGLRAVGATLVASFAPTNAFLLAIMISFVLGTILKQITEITGRNRSNFHTLPHVLRGSHSATAVKMPFQVVVARENIEKAFVRQPNEMRQPRLKQKKRGKTYHAFVRFTFVGTDGFRASCVTDHRYRRRVGGSWPCSARVFISRMMVRRLTPRAWARSASVGAACCAAASLNLRATTACRGPSYRQWPHLPGLRWSR